MEKNSEISLIEPIENKILLFRGQRVVLDFHLAELYGVSTKVLNQAVKRNIERFPPDFMFQLNFKEAKDSKSQFMILQKGMNIKYLPYAFTEHGAIMAATVLNSPLAIKASIFVVRAFVKLKYLFGSHRELAQKLDELERNVAVHDKAICSLFDAIRNLMDLPQKKKRKIGFDLGANR